MMVLVILAGLLAGVLTFANAEKAEQAAVITRKPASFGGGIPGECVNAPNGPLPPVCQNLGRPRGGADAGAR
jgi:hypothetical protein